MKVAVPAVIAVSTLVSACGFMATNKATYQARALAPDELQMVREKVRGYAKTHCGTCHMASLPTALPRALAIYNLDADAWSSTLTATQLRNGFPGRLTSRLDEEGRRNLLAFIEGELALRQ